MIFYYQRWNNLLCKGGGGQGRVYTSTGSTAINLEDQQIVFELREKEKRVFQDFEKFARNEIAKLDVYEKICREAVIGGKAVEELKTGLQNLHRINLLDTSGNSPTVSKSKTRRSGRGRSKKKGNTVEPVEFKTSVVDSAQLYLPESILDGSAGSVEEPVTAEDGMPPLPINRVKRLVDDCKQKDTPSSVDLPTMASDSDLEMIMLQQQKSKDDSDLTSKRKKKELPENAVSLPSVDESGKDNENSSEYKNPKIVDKNMETTRSERAPSVQQAVPLIEPKNIISLRVKDETVPVTSASKESDSAAAMPKNTPKAKKSPKSKLKIETDDIRSQSGLSQISTASRPFTPGFHLDDTEVDVSILAATQAGLKIAPNKTKIRPFLTSTSSPPSVTSTGGTRKNQNGFYPDRPRQTPKGGETPTPGRSPVSKNNFDTDRTHSSVATVSTKNVSEPVTPAVKSAESPTKNQRAKIAPKRDQVRPFS